MSVLSGKWQKKRVENGQGHGTIIVSHPCPGIGVSGMNRKKQKDLKITALYCRLSLEDGKGNESMSISNQKPMLKQL